MHYHSVYFVLLVDFFWSFMLATAFTRCNHLVQRHVNTGLVTFHMNDDNNNNNGDENSRNGFIPTQTSGTSSTLSEAQSLQEQLRTLRNEIQQDIETLEQNKQVQEQRKRDKVDQWIEQLFVAVRIRSHNSKSTAAANDDDDDTQILLNSVETVAQKLIKERYSSDQVYDIFQRLTQEDPFSRVHSPLVELLVDACNRVDCLEEQDNPNKRWKGRVEMKLRRRMFAMERGIELEEDKETNLYD